MSDTTITPAEAVAMLEADKRTRVETVAKIMQDALVKYKCDLIGIPQIAPDGRIVALVKIVAR